MILGNGDSYWVGPFKGSPRYDKMASFMCIACATYLEDDDSVLYPFAPDSSEMHTRVWHTSCLMNVLHEHAATGCSELEFEQYRQAILLRRTGPDTRATSSTGRATPS